MLELRIDQEEGLRGVRHSQDLGAVHHILLLGLEAGQAERRTLDFVVGTDCFEEDILRNLAAVVGLEVHRNLDSGPDTDCLVEDSRLRGPGAGLEGLRIPAGNSLDSSAVEVLDYSLAARKVVAVVVDALLVAGKASLYMVSVVFVNAPQL